jgi:hypothetical protein
MRKLYTIGILLLVSTLFSCRESKVEHCDAYAVIKTWKVRPVSIHDEITPKYQAVLSNGDTIPCDNYTKAGDTIYYTYIKVQD